MQRHANIFLITLSSTLFEMLLFIFRSLLVLIHRTIEFLVREGPLFEAMLMGRERHNPVYRYVFHRSRSILWLLFFEKTFSKFK